VNGAVPAYWVISPHSRLSGRRVRANGHIWVTSTHSSCGGRRVLGSHPPHAECWVLTHPTPSVGFSPTRRPRDPNHRRSIHVRRGGTPRRLGSPASASSGQAGVSPTLAEQAAANLRHPLSLTLLALTFSTGTVDAVSYLGLGHVFTANMTGNVVLLGFGIAGAGGLPVGSPIVSLPAFGIGSGIGGALARRMLTGFRLTFPLRSDSRSLGSPARRSLPPRPIRTRRRSPPTPRSR